MRTPIYEQETIILMSRDNDTAKVYTSDYTMMTKFDKICADSDCWQKTRETYCEGDVASCEYTAPKSMISFRKRQRQMTEEQRQQCAERLQEMRKDSASQKNL